MKRNFGLLRRYIREAIDLGDVQFSPNRIDGASKTEPDTPEEKVLNNALRSRISANGKISPEIAQQLSDLIDSDRYGVKGSGFFQGPRAGAQLYRGHAFDDQWFDEHFAGGVNLSSTPWMMNLPEMLKNVKPVTLSKPYVFEQFRGWTYDINVAIGWASNYATKAKNKYSTVLIVNSDDVKHGAMLDLSAGVYKTDYGDYYKEESEVMNLAPITVTTAKIVKFVEK